jgi:hypothetical protein
MWRETTSWFGGARATTAEARSVAAACRLRLRVGAMMRIGNQAAQELDDLGVSHAVRGGG